MAINKTEWEQIKSMLLGVDQVGIEEKFDKFRGEVDAKMSACEGFWDRQINKKLDEIDKSAESWKQQLNSDRFSVTVDNVLTVLEKHGYNFPINKQVGRYEEGTHFDVYTVDLHDVLKFASEYCQKLEEKDSYLQWCKIKDAGLTERRGMPR